MKWKRRSWTRLRLWLLWTLALVAATALTELTQTGLAQTGGAQTGGAQPAAPATTTISDTIYRADGTPASGTALISWPAFTTAAGANVPAGSISVTIAANGLLSVPLVANAGSNPMGSYYTVVYHLGDGSVTREYWVVPASAGAVKVSAIRSAVLPASVAMQTVSKSYVDTAIAAAVARGSSTSGSSSTQTLAGQTLALLPERANLLGEHLLIEGTGSIAHDTSGQGNDAPITGATWEGTVDLNFPTTGAFYQLPTAENQTNTWMFALYAAPLGNAQAPLPPGYGAVSNFGGNPSILCGSTQQLTCFIATSFYGPKTHRLLAFGGGDLTESAEALTAGVHIVTIVCGDGGANLTRYYYDGSEVGAYLTQGNAACNHSATGNYQIGGSTAFGGTWFTGKMAGDWEWSTRLSPGEVEAATRMARQFIDGKGFGEATRGPRCGPPRC